MELETLTRGQRIEMMENDHVCPVCGVRHVDFEELLACLGEHDDEGIIIAADYIPLANRLMFEEDANDILESEDEMDDR